MVKVGVEPEGTEGTVVMEERPNGVVTLSVAVTMIVMVGTIERDITMVVAMWGMFNMVRIRVRWERVMRFRMRRKRVVGFGKVVGIHWVVRMVVVGVLMVVVVPVLVVVVVGIVMVLIPVRLFVMVVTMPVLMAISVLVVVRMTVSVVTTVDVVDVVRRIRNGLCGGVCDRRDINWHLSMKKVFLLQYLIFEDGSMRSHCDLVGCGRGHLQIRGDLGRGRRRGYGTQEHWQQGPHL